MQRLLLLQSAGSRAQAQQLRCEDVGAPRPVGPSQVREDQTHVSCTSRRILNRRATRKALRSLISVELWWDKFLLPSKVSQMSVHIHTRVPTRLDSVSIRIIAED